MAAVPSSSVASRASANGIGPGLAVPANAARHSDRVIGTAFVQTVIDDHCRVAYAEICTDEKSATAIGVLQRAGVWFADHGFTGGTSSAPRY